MRRIHLFLPAVLLATGLVCGAAAAATAGRVIVKLRADASLVHEAAITQDLDRPAVVERAQRRASALGGRLGLGLTSGRMLGERSQVLLSTTVDSAALAARLALQPDVEYAVVDRRQRRLAVPNDPLYAAGPTSGLGPKVGQWYLHPPTADVRSSVNAEQAWDLVTPNPNLVVAVLDTGVLATHPDLAGQVLAGYDMIDDAAVANDGNGRDSDASDAGDWITGSESTNRKGDFYQCTVEDSSWHGTMVSGIIGAASNNAIGMAGIASGVRILPVRVLGKCGGYDSDIIAGLQWAAGLSVPGVPNNPNPARVLNLSLGSDGDCSQAYRSAIASITAAPRLAVIVAAAGNSSGHAVGTPANCPDVIAVAGLRHAGSKVGFSDLGPEVSIAAPAGNCINVGDSDPCLYPILTSTNTGTRLPAAHGSTWTDSYNASVGTSFSSPIVAGTVALMLSARPQWTPAEVKAALQRSAQPFPTSGANNGVDDPTPVPMCQAPTGADQLQCYCASGLCGAGMLDTAAAVLGAVQGVMPVDAAEQLLDFGEVHYSAYFSSHPATQSSPPFRYRYYPGTGAFLGVVVNSDSRYRLGGVYVLGDPFGDEPIYVGQLSDFVTPTATALSAHRSP